MTSVAATSHARALWRDYLELTKPRVVALMILTTLVGMFLAIDGMVSLQILLWGNIGIALCAGSAAVINHVVDQRIDTLMRRTKNRPVAQGRIQHWQALLFSLVIGLAGMGLLFYFVNALTAWLTFGALIGYAIIYTMVLKRATPQNIVIGGLAGAAPPLLGWTAVTNQVDPDALLLVLIIFAWTPPHFWALAIARHEDYAKADIPMLPVTHGEKYTRLHILLYTIIMIVVTVLPWTTRMFDWIYLSGALLLGAGFLYWSIRIMNANDKKAPMETFKYSIIYLFALFVVMLVDHYVYPDSERARYHFPAKIELNLDAQ